MNIRYIEFDDYIPAPHKQQGMRSSTKDSVRSVSSEHYTITDLGDKVQVEYAQTGDCVVVPWAKAKYAILEAPVSPSEATEDPKATSTPAEAPKRRGRPPKAR